MKRRSQNEVTEDPISGLAVRVWKELASWERLSWTNALFLGPGILVIDGWTTYNRGYDLFLLANMRLRVYGDPWFRTPPDSIIDSLAGLQDYYSGKCKRIPPEWIT